MSTTWPTNQELGEARALLRSAGIGAAVVMTQQAIDWGVSETKHRGVIVGWGRSKWAVRVRKDGCKETINYHVTFWEPL